MSISAVARVVWLSSDAIVQSLPPPPARPLLEPSLRSSHQPVIASLPHAADVGSTIISTASKGVTLLSYLSHASAELAHSLILHLTQLSERPVVFSLALSSGQDLSDVLLLRSATPYFILSTEAQQAHDNALLAARLARVEKKAVVHVFYDVNGEVDTVPEDAIQPFLAASLEQTTGITNEAEELDPTKESYKLYELASHSAASLTGRPLLPFVKSGSDEPHTVILVVGQTGPLPDVEGVAFIRSSLLSPFFASRVSSVIPLSASRVIVAEQITRWPTKWTPFYLDVVAALQNREPRPKVHSCGFGPRTSFTEGQVQKLIERASSSSISERLHLNTNPSPSFSHVPHVPRHESAYTRILSQLFGDRLNVANSPELVSTQGKMATTPEFALGRVRAQLEQRAELMQAVSELLEFSDLDVTLHSLLAEWAMKKDDPVKSRSIGKQIIDRFESSPVRHPAADRAYDLRDHFPALSRWIIGSDAWSHDIGSSGLHHVISSGLNVNILLLDTLPYSARNSLDPNRRKQDVGLYAMNHGDVFVASVAVYSSHAQVLQAIMEADKYNGPSVVLGYLPYLDENTTALEILKETKLAVDNGYWPLYRWNPSKELQGQDPFSLDSDAIKNELKAFLDRQNHLSQLVQPNPQLASELVSNLGDSIKEARKRRAEQSFNDLMNGLDAPPLLVLFASDSGAAEKRAKRLANRGKARGMSTTVATFDSYTIESLGKEEYVAFVTSVAGQGEPPQNGRHLFKAINAAALANEKPLTNLKFTVFGMGDRHYWPRPEDAQYYNKPGRDLDLRLEQLGGERIADLGLGDDQDPDGPETGYKVWEPLVWKALGVDSVEVTEAEPEPITNEHIKAASRYLRGTIAEGLEDTSTGALAASDGQLTKFHGIYQQDDRDIREEREAQGVEPAYSFMIRVRMPGGVCTPTQWLQMDRIADERGCGTFKITTRQTFQFHGVIKKHLKAAIQGINKVLLDTLAACGDVNRNVICSSMPTRSKLHRQVYEFSKGVSSHLIPRTTAYHEIWLDKKMVAGEAVQDFEPLYGEFYLPRKFKIAVAVPPTNDVDVFANDLGFIAIVDDNGDLAGFNVAIGGGMGVTHGNKKTYPRIATEIGFCTVEQGNDVAEKVMLVQRDYGNRKDRKNARLKYTIDSMGLENFKNEVEKRLGYKLQPLRPYTFDRNIDDFGWHQGEDGNHHFTMFIENGRVQDEPDRDYKTGLREVAKIHTGTLRLTTNQHLVISDIVPENVEKIKDVLSKYRLDNLSYSGLRLSSSACVAFPTCGLAMAESERYLPILISKVEDLLEECGLRNDSIVMRMTGCPNGCARPYVAEVAFVGKAPGAYLMLLGGGYYGQRMNKIYRENVTEPEILAILGPMFKRYALERQEGEHFGDWTIRAGYISPTESGLTFYDRMGGEGEHREVAVA